MTQEELAREAFKTMSQMPQINVQVVSEPWWKTALKIGVGVAIGAGATFAYLTMNNEGGGE